MFFQRLHKRRSSSGEDNKTAQLPSSAQDLLFSGYSGLGQVIFIEGVHTNYKTWSARTRPQRSQPASTRLCTVLLMHNTHPSLMSTLEWINGFDLLHKYWQYSICIENRRECLQRTVYVSLSCFFWLLFFFLPCWGSEESEQRLSFWKYNYPEVWPVSKNDEHPGIYCTPQQTLPIPLFWQVFQIFDLDPDIVWSWVPCLQCVAAALKDQHFILGGLSCLRWAPEQHYLFLMKGINTEQDYLFRGASGECNHKEPAGVRREDGFILFYFLAYDSKKVHLQAWQIKKKCLFNENFTDIKIEEQLHIVFISFFLWARCSQKRHEIWWSTLLLNYACFCIKHCTTSATTATVPAVLSKAGLGEDMDTTAILLQR